MESRRKNQTNNILNDLDNPVVDINISEIDKNDHYRQKTNQNTTNSNQKEMVTGEFSYNTMKNNTTRQPNSINNNLGNSGNYNESGLGLFNSRRHVNNTSTLNNL